MAEENKTLTEQLGELTQLVKDSQTKLDQGASKFDASVKERVEEAAKLAESMQQLEQKQKGIEESQKFLEQQLSRVGDGADNTQGELHKKMSQEVARYLRTGQEVTAEVLEEMHKDVAKHTLHGATDADLEAFTKSLSAGSNADGGYWIMPQRAAKTIQRIFETSPMRLVANIMTTTTDSMEFIIDDDEMSTGGWVGETDARSVTNTAKIGKLTIPVHEQFAQPKATQKMLDDAGFDVESWVASKVADKMTRTENTAFIIGDGSQKPRGILALPAWTSAGVYERSALERINSGASGAFTGDGLKRIQNSVKEAYQPGAVWGMKRASFTDIATLKDSNGAYLLDPRSLKDGDSLQLLGKRIIFMDDVPAVGAGSESLIYGNFQQGYSIVDRIGFRVIRDNVTLKPFILFYTTKRTGGDVTNYEALKVQKLSV